MSRERRSHGETGLSLPCGCWLCGVRESTEGGRGLEGGRTDGRTQPQGEETGGGGDREAPALPLWTPPEPWGGVCAHKHRLLGRWSPKPCPSVRAGAPCTLLVLQLSLESAAAFHQGPVGLGTRASAGPGRESLRRRLRAIWGGSPASLHRRFPRCWRGGADFEGLSCRLGGLCICSTPGTPWRNTDTQYRVVLSLRAREWGVGRRTQLGKDPPPRDLGDRLRSGHQTPCLSDAG